MKKINTLVFVLVVLLSACKTESSEKTNQSVDTKKSEAVSNKNKVANNPPASTRQANAPSAPVQLKTESDQLLFLSNIFRKYSSNGKTFTDQISAELQKVDNKDLDFIKKFVFNSTQQSSDLLSDEFLKKPSKEELQQLFKLRHINWNSMSVNGVTTAVIDTFDINSVGNSELVTAYYRLLMNGLQLQRNRDANFKNVSINLNKLDLKTPQEKGIAFYIIADAFSTKYNRFLKRVNFDCKQAKELATEFPTINGKALFNAKPPSFKDFRFVLGNNAPNRSFQDSFTKRFAQASAHFKSCK